jgi:glycosyl transferase family 25
MENQSSIAITEFFEKIYIVNLLERTDRLREIQEQLNLINLSNNHTSVYVFPAVRPTDQGEFDSIGARGCFLSHLGILKDAAFHNYKNILILEDDVNFSDNFITESTKAFKELSDRKWDIFYGGIKLTLDETTISSNVQAVPSKTGIMTTHFVAFNGDVIIKFITELELMLTRKGGDPQGGPMHVDGAYSTIRGNYPEYKTFVALPVLAYQRASMTDIHELRWFDRVFLIRNIVAILRKFKNTL